MTSRPHLPGYYANFPIQTDVKYCLKQVKISTFRKQIQKFREYLTICTSLRANLYKISEILIILSVLLFVVRRRHTTPLGDLRIKARVRCLVPFCVRSIVVVPVPVSVVDLQGPEAAAAVKTTIKN